MPMCLLGGAVRLAANGGLVSDGVDSIVPFVSSGISQSSGGRRWRDDKTGNAKAHSGSTSAPSPASALAVGTALGACLAARRRPRLLPRRQEASSRRSRGGETATEDSIQSELRVLNHLASEAQREAARAKAEVAELLDARAKRREQEQRKWFGVFDLDGSGGIDAKELQMGMQELSGDMVDESTAERLLEAHDMNQNGVLEPAEFDTMSLEVTLEKLRAERRAEEEALRRAQLELKRLEETAQHFLEYNKTLPARNEDRGLLVRLGSMLAYMLPFVDGLRFGMPLVPESAAFQSFIWSLAPILSTLQSVPFFGIFLFITMQMLADKTDLPHLLRYNLRQAVLLDILVGVLALIESVATLMVDGEIPIDIWESWTSNGAIFIALVGVIVYAVGAALLGITARLPFISRYAEETMAPTRPSAVDEWAEALAAEKDNTKA